MLRSGELLGLRSSHVLCAPKDRQVLISLGLTKGGKRQGAAESVILGIESWGGCNSALETPYERQHSFSSFSSHVEKSF